MKHLDQLRISDAGVKVLVEREGLKTTAYLDEVAQPPVWTIGIGHTSAAGPPKVTSGMTISEDEAWSIFWTDTERFRAEARKLVTVPLEQHQLDALASFVFNIGTTQFRKSTVLKRLNAGDYPGAGEAILMWDKPAAIISRRRGEHQQFAMGRYTARIDESGKAV
jgi:lysozyme